MKGALVIRHVHFEDLGTIEPFLLEEGYAVQYIDASVDDLTSLDAATPDLVVVLGGPIGAFDDDVYPFLRAELTFVQKRLDAGLPILGICLGAQLIARALGAGVAPMGHKEIGFAPVSLTTAGEDSVLAALGTTPVLHWHGDMFEIPANATSLATTELCANQAFALGSSVLALQFHLEADTKLIERWLVGHAHELSTSGIRPQELRSHARQFESELAKVSRQVIGPWLAMAASHAAASNTMM